MRLLEVNKIKVYMKDRLLIDADHLQIHKRDRIGIVGRNGSGKTTLLKVLAGEKSPEEGTVVRHAACELLPQLKRTDTTKSGGEITQEYIHDALAKDPEILLADEPTTHLDTDHIEWLEKKLLKWPGALVIVSHDRSFLDALCQTIWEIQDGQVKVYKGNYSDYTAHKERERREEQTAYENYTRKKKQLEEAFELKQKKAEKAVKVPKEVNSIEAKKAKPYFAKKQKKLQQTANAIETRLNKLEKVEKTREAPPIKMNLPHEKTFKDRIVLRIEKVSGVIDQRLLWEPVSFHLRGGDKLAITGPNGSGKTTLVKKFMHQADGITMSPSMKIGYFSQNLDILNSHQTILDNVSSTSKQEETLIRTVLARLHFFRDDVYKRIEVLSGGERVKVALAKLFLSDINTLILDEPTNFLDTEAVEALESLLKEYEGSVIFVTHDRRFIEQVASRILTIKEKKIELFEGTYGQYKQYIPLETPNIREDHRLLLDTKISEVLSRLSIEPSEQLEMEFQKLLKEKRELDRHDAPMQ